MYIYNFVYISSGEYIYKPWAFDTLIIYLYMCVIVVSVNIFENNMFKPNALVSFFL